MNRDINFIGTIQVTLPVTTKPRTLPVYQKTGKNYRKWSISAKISRMTFFGMPIRVLRGFEYFL